MAIQRDNPRISINQLANYLVSTPSRRRRIIQDQKHPPTFRVNWYEFATNAISTFILGGCSNDTILTDEIGRLYSEPPQSEYEETRYRTNAEALESFLDAYDQIDYQGFNVAAGQNDPPKLRISGVDVSVRPEFVVSGEYRQHQVVGALKLYFSKDQPLTEASARYITAVVCRYAQEHLISGEATTRNQLCQVFDVFGGTLYSAPTAVTRRFHDINIACQEVSLWWPVV